MAQARARRRGAGRRGAGRRGTARRPSRSRRPGRRRPVSRLRWAGPAAVLLGLLAWDWLVDHPVRLVLTLTTLAGVGLAAAGSYLAWVISQRRRQAALTRSVAVADTLDGPQFERWVATLMRRTGFTEVQVSGGAGDLGADITARGPDRRRVVVQCKRHQAGRSVGSPAVQKLAGTARALHDADVAAIVTTSGFTEPARTVAGMLRIGLVDRDALARWASDGLLPVALVQPVATGSDGMRRPADPPLPSRRTAR